MCAMNVGIVMPNLAALRATVFTLSEKKTKGGGRISAPVGAQIKFRYQSLRFVTPEMLVFFRETLAQLGAKRLREGCRTPPLP